MKDMTILQPLKGLCYSTMVPDDPANRHLMKMTGQKARTLGFRTVLGVRRARTPTAP